MLQQLRELLLGGKTLSSGNGDRTPSGYLDHGRDVGVRHGLLKPGRPKLSDRVRGFDSRGRVESAMTLDQQVDGIAHRVPDRPYDVKTEIKPVARQRPPVIA